MFRLRSPRFVLAAALLLSTSAFAGDLHINLPKRTKPTPVQKLNQDGVKALQKHDYERARRIFYRAYLLDPNDPFTLNNLGYVAELNGEIERAQRYYQLASEQNSEAQVALSTSDEAKGKPVDKVAGSAADTQMQVNRYNVYAMGLLMKDRAPEADLILQKALQIDPANPFTLNNLGFTKEKEGEYQEALKFYNEAASKNSAEPIVVTINRNWRGKGISEIAAENARNLRRLMEREDDLPNRIARLNLRGVSALNRNDRRAARDHFQEAYKLDQNNAFTLNNMGYLAEQDGDRETADFYYAKAREADRANAKVVVATRRDVEGMKVGHVADQTDNAVQAAVEEDRQARQRQGGPVILKRRDNTPVQEPPVPPTPEENPK